MPRPPAAAKRSPNAAVVNDLEELRPRLVALATRLTGDHAAAEDIAQETVIRAVERLDRLDLGAPLWPWLARVARNLCIDRHRRARGTVLIYDHDQLDRHAAQAAPAGDEVVVERALLTAALQRLAPRQQAVVVLRHLAGYTSHEAARLLGTSPHAGEQLLHRAHLALRREYTRLDPDTKRGLLPLPWLLGDRLWTRLQASWQRLAQLPVGEAAQAALCAVAVLVFSATAAIPTAAGSTLTPSANLASEDDNANAMDRPMSGAGSAATPPPQTVTGTAATPPGENDPPGRVLDPVTDVTGPPRASLGIMTHDGAQPDAVVEVDSPATSDPVAYELYVGAVHRGQHCAEGNWDPCRGVRDADEDNDSEEETLHVQASIP